jgi:hypothetical protein
LRNAYSEKENVRLYKLKYFWRKKLVKALRESSARHIEWAAKFPPLDQMPLQQSSWSPFENSPYIQSLVVRSGCDPLHFAALANSQTGS